MSYTKLLYHIIFSTKYRRKTIPNEQSDKLYRYIWGFIEKHKCVLYRINGMPDHIHIFVQLHPTIAVSTFVKKLKNATHFWLDENKVDFPDFESWSVGYCALSYCERDKEMIVNYIKKQREHHKAEESDIELRRILGENNISIDEQYFDKEL